MRGAVREVSKYFPTAIISGRSRDKVKRFVQLQSVYYAGSHGMDIAAPSIPIKVNYSNLYLNLTMYHYNAVISIDLFNCREMKFYSNQQRCFCLRFKRLETAFLRDKAIVFSWSLKY